MALEGGLGDMIQSHACTIICNHILVMTCNSSYNRT
jgi:hypothetical protein